MSELSASNCSLVYFCAQNCEWTLEYLLFKKFKFEHSLQLILDYVKSHHGFRFWSTKFLLKRENIKNGENSAVQPHEISVRHRIKMFKIATNQCKGKNVWVLIICTCCREYCQLGSLEDQLLIFGVKRKHISALSLASNKVESLWIKYISYPAIWYFHDYCHLWTIYKNPAGVKCTENIRQLYQFSI